MAITLPIKTNNDYSSWVYTPAAFIAQRVIPTASILLPRSSRQKLYNYLANKEEAISSHRRITGDYPARTWYGLNGWDQYDLVADCTNNVSKHL